MGCKPNIALGLGHADQFLNNPDARPIADDVGMGGQLENTAFLICRFKLTPENIKHRGGWRMGAQGLETVHHEIDRIITYPLYRQFDHTGGRAIEQ